MAFRREKKRIGDMLINENVITQEQLEKALPIAKEKHKKIGETLIELGFTNELEIAKALSQQLGLELVNVSAINIPEEVQNLVSETVLRKHVMIPYAFDKNNANVVHVAMADPMDMVALDDFSIVTNLQAEPAVATGRDILLTLDKYYGDTEAMKAAQEYARERKEREQKNAEAEEATSKDVNNSPVVLLVNSIIEQAARTAARYSRLVNSLISLLQWILLLTLNAICFRLSLSGRDTTRFSVFKRISSFHAFRRESQGFYLLKSGNPLFP